GSTSHMLSAALQESDYRVGLYTSPHLVDFRERIRINGKPISKQWVVDFVDNHKALIEEIQPSFFEITVAMAFVAFAEEKVDFAVIETGLGGRLDSTNIVVPILSIITNISYDHKDVLGETLQEIAAEKAGIIKENTPVLIGELIPETERVFFEHAMHKKSTVYYADSMWDLVRTRQDLQGQYFKAINRGRREMHELFTDMRGNYQYHNIKTVLAAADILIANQGIHLPFENTLRSLGKVKKMTGLRGRWEILQQHPLVIADVGHNPAGVKEVLKQWHDAAARKKHIIVGFVKDKDVTEALSVFPKDAVYHFCNAGIPRAMPAAELAAVAEQNGLGGHVYDSVAAATQGALQAMQNDDALLITGSFFVVGEAIAALSASEQLAQTE
ncbi:MAG: bifunctional folylpolyglutamate synthase/dihydrofolate synthase, partial [Flavipsychrobacter sp.]|nr:bifunctional folylpolyglutamate synthase/dihydrofolate synthase [Flavipsychrobacter sp.]